VLASFADQQHLMEAAQVAVTSSQWAAAAALIKELYKKDPNNHPTADSPDPEAAAPARNTTSKPETALGNRKSTGSALSPSAAAVAAAEEADKQLAQQLHELLQGLPVEQLEALISALAHGWGGEAATRAGQEQQLAAEHKMMQTEKASWQHLFVGILLDAKRAAHSQPQQDLAGMQG
jgi:hypothetical protein